MHSPLVIWRFSDGRRGHDNQSLGLAEALARLMPVNCVEITVRGGLSGALGALGAGGEHPRPALVLGAGHATHLALIVAARRQQARSVVLMNPSVPRGLFDLCLVPAHDGIPAAANVVLTLGALNRMRPSSGRDPDQALILLGGPSRHHAWDDGPMLAQIRDLIAAAPGRRWLVAGSPRTPTSMLESLTAISAAHVVPFEATATGWLPGRLARASEVWVSEDSVSMAYEAVSCGAPTGLLEVAPRRRSRSRVQAAARMLLDEHLVISMSQWRAGVALAVPPRIPQEADRCARIVLERWPDLA